MSCVKISFLHYDNIIMATKYNNMNYLQTLHAIYDVDVKIDKNIIVLESSILTNLHNM